MTNKNEGAKFQMLILEPYSNSCRRDLRTSNGGNNHFEKNVLIFSHSEHVFRFTDEHLIWFNGKKFFNDKKYRWNDETSRL